MTSLGRWAVVLVAAALAGCGEQGVPVPTDRFHRLAVAGPESVYTSPRLHGILEVERFDAAGVLQGRQIIFVEHDSPNVLHEYHYHLWVDPPTRLLQNVTADYLREANLADQVIVAGLRIEPNYTLAGEIRQLEHVVGNSARVSVELEFRLRKNETDSLVWAKTYKATRDVADDTVGSATRAMAEAVAEILTRLSADLGRQ